MQTTKTHKKGVFVDFDISLLCTSYLVAGMLAAEERGERRESESPVFDQSLAVVGCRAGIEAHICSVRRR